ncbi:hypothetical protein BH11PSE11_BH11PSE11_02370 [soil metagenome]
MKNPIPMSASLEKSASDGTLPDSSKQQFLGRYRDRMSRAGVILLWASIGFYGLLIAHDFSAYIDSFPYLALDDSLANVSFALAKQGTYGFLASPLQAPGDWLRNDGFFNYGPWYFYFGALLIWLFGYSLALMRSIHLIVLIAIVILGFCWFRRKGSSVPAAIAALAILWTFQAAHWPMVRPDVFVSLFAALFLVAAGCAIHSSRSSVWIWVGLSASCAALTHLIAWALVPAAALVWIRHEQWRHCQKSDGEKWDVRASMCRGACLMIGGLAGAAMFYASFDFRFRDHWATLAAYRSFVDSGPAASNGFVAYLEVLGKHITIAIGFLPPRVKLLAYVVPILGWGLLTGLMIWGKDKVRTSGESLLLPPLLVLSLYLLSLGAYPNYHLGYAILTQVMLCWVLASLLAVGHVWIKATAIRCAPWYSSLLLVAGLIAGTMIIRAELRAESSRSTQAAKWVPISELMKELVADLPKRGTAWGSVVFGAENPGTLQLVQFGEADRLISAVPIAERSRLAPDYLVWGYPENRDSTLNVLRGKGGALARVDALLPGEHYRLAKLLYAKPYGSTRLYQRVSGSEASASNTPYISMYRADKSYWVRVDWHALNVRMESAGSTMLGIGYDEKPGLNAARESWKAELPPGDYVFRAALTRATDGQKLPGFLAITDTREARETIGELGPQGDVATHLTDEAEVFLVRSHAGGPVYVSYYGGSGFRISDIKIFPMHGVDQAQKSREKSGFITLPAFSKWTLAAGAKLVNKGSHDELSADETQWGYQLVSPSLKVAPQSKLVVRLDYEAIAGKVCAGILDEKGNWLIAADRAEHEFAFNSGTNSAINLVFANCNVPQNPGKTSGTFKLKHGEYRITSSRIYTEDLVQEFKAARENRTPK